jgi:tetratricopeptide (TPR) repeat protein
VRRRLGGIFVAFAASLSACVYQNVLFNAGGLFERAESDRRAGRYEEARAAYRDVARKTGEAVRGRPDADWAEEALLLYARARLRLGEYAAAEGALEEARRRAADPGTRAEVAVYRAAVQEQTGDTVGALATVNDALPAVTGAAQVEAHLLRGRLLMRRGQTEYGWWDLDQAVHLDPAVRAEAGLERLRWAIEQEDRGRTERALAGLLADPRASVLADTVSVLARAGRGLWGPASGAVLLEGAERSRWDREARGQLRLQRARFLDEAGDSAAAVAEALDVARGLGTSAADARLLVADWRARDISALDEAYALRPLLLPAADDPRVMDRLAAIDDFERRIAVGLEEPLGLFAAAEVARDRIGAPLLARGLFLAYVDGAPDEPWSAKALLAALEMSPDAGDRAWIRLRVEAYPDSPYVLAANGGSAAGFAELEGELEDRLRELIRE